METAVQPLWYKNVERSGGRLKQVNVTEIKAVNLWSSLWKQFSEKHPTLAELMVFFLLSNVITVLQLILMPVFKTVFNQTALVNVNFQIGQLGHNPDGSPYFMFDYLAGPIKEGGGGGLAYFLAVQLTLGIATVINFFTQRKITFKATGSLWKAAGWYLAAYIAITVGAAALQGLYKTPIYEFCIRHLSAGETMADVVTMLINCAISFWVYYPIMKFIFRQK